MLSTEIELDITEMGFFTSFCYFKPSTWAWWIIWVFLVHGFCLGVVFFFFFFSLRNKMDKIFKEVFQVYRQVYCPGSSYFLQGILPIILYVVIKRQGGLFMPHDPNNQVSLRQATRKMAGPDDREVFRSCFSTYHFLYIFFLIFNKNSTFCWNSKLKR